MVEVKLYSYKQVTRIKDSAIVFSCPKWLKWFIIKFSTIHFIEDINNVKTKGDYMFDKYVNDDAIITKLNELKCETYKSDLKQRATDFKKHYDINSKFIYDGSDLFKDNKSILKFEKGLPYNWIIQENVTKQ